MGQRYKVFINQSSIFFTSENLFQGKEIQLNLNAVKDCYDFFSKAQEGENHFIFRTKTPEIDFKKFKNHFENIEAAGGLVYNESNQTLWIHRLGIWDLPKGKIEPNEEVKTAAIREIEEECGISNPKILDDFGKSFHMYSMKEKVVFKTTHWFTMIYTGSEELKPQLEEDITEVEWVDSTDLIQKINSTYPSISELFKP